VIAVVGEYVAPAAPTNNPPEDCAVYQPENIKPDLLAVGNTSAVPLLKVAVEVPVVPDVPMIPLLAEALYVTKTPAGVADT
jgi:hypothetical protein